MFCERCGSQLLGGQRFCSSCGKPVGMAIVPPEQHRVARHVRLLGALWLARGVLTLLTAGAMFIAGGFVRRIVGPIVTDIAGVPVGNLVTQVVLWLAICTVGLALAYVAAGVGLLNHESWARMLALVLAFISLVSVPFGTALGIYTLWVLLPMPSEEEYQRLARAA